MATLAPGTLRITDSHQGKVDVPFVRSRAFQLKTKEAQAAPDVVTSIYLISILFIVLLFMVIVYLEL